MTLSSATRPTAIPTRSKPFTISLSCEVSPPEIDMLRHLGALAQADRDGVEHGGVRLIDGDVVHERERLGADADHVVDVHGDAIDADGVELAHHGRDDRLGSHAVGAEREAGAVHLDDIGEVADRQQHPAHALPGPGALDPLDDMAQPRIRLGGVDAGLLVDFLSHVHGPALCLSGLALDKGITSPLPLAMVPSPVCLPDWATAKSAGRPVSDGPGSR